jgi:ABC-type multidrug transport system fused ATPase/permease subunit
LIDQLAEEEEKRDKKGFELVVGIRGGKLSGGQKQRVAIARTIIRHPNVYLFDEATSALDNENETIVQASLDNLSSDKTSITIAHRYATIMNADKIFVFVKGRIVENGTYPELIEKKGIFYNLVHGYPVS